jgi:TIR domain-containing protein
MPSQEDIKHQQDLLAIYRRNLSHLLKQAAHFGGEENVPINIFNSIQEARSNIKRVKGILRGWSGYVEDEPDDGDKPTPAAPTVVSSQTTSSASATAEPQAGTPGTPSTQRPLRAFLCHSSDDKPAVRDLYRRLRAEGVEPWLDEEELLAGQDWDLEITKAVRTTDVVIVCLSRGSVNKVGYVQKELRRILDVAEEQPEGKIFVIPLKLEECEPPERLRRLQAVNLFEERGFERLMRALRARANEIRATISPAA